MRKYFPTCTRYVIKQIVKLMIEICTVKPRIKEQPILELQAEVVLIQWVLKKKSD